MARAKTVPETMPETKPTSKTAAKSAVKPATKPGDARPEQTRVDEAVKRDLLNQLQRNDIVGEQYTSLVEDYMNMWSIKELLIEDIHKRGVLVETMTGNGFMVAKKNDSVDQLTRVNSQMLKLLSEIGIKPSQGGGDEDEL